MPNTQTYDTPSFSRITGKGQPTSWAVGLPITLLVVALIGLFIYFASKATSYSEQLGQARQQLTTQQQSLEAAQKRLTQLETDNQLARSPGRTTVMLRPQGADETKAADGAWGAAVWGETAGKGFVELRAYGLKAPPPQGKMYQAWFEATDGKPLLLGTLDPGPNGAAFVEGKDLSGLDKGKRVFVTLGSEDAKTVDGPTLFEGSLAKATPEQEQPAEQPEAQGRKAGRRRR